MRQQVAAENVTAQSKAALAGLQTVMDQRNAELDALRAQAVTARGTDLDTIDRKAQHVADLIGALQVNQDDVSTQAAVYSQSVSDTCAKRKNSSNVSKRISSASTASPGTRRS